MTDTKKLYDTLGSDYLSSMYTDNSWTRYVDSSEKHLVKQLIGSHFPQKLSQSQLLDLGMGPGRWSKFFIDMGFKKVVGVDISESMVLSARHYVNSKKFQAIQTSMENIPNSNSVFDIAFCFRAFKYVSDPSLTLLEIHKVLKPNGLFIIEVSNANLINKFFCYFSKIVVSVFPATPLVSKWRYFQRAKFYSKSQIHQLLLDSKFTSVSTISLFVLPSIPLPSLLTDLLITFDKLLCKVLPHSLFGRSWVISAIKQS